MAHRLATNVMDVREHAILHGAQRLRTRVAAGMPNFALAIVQHVTQ